MCTSSRRSEITNWTALRIAAESEHIRCALHLLCFGAEIDEPTILLEPIEKRLKFLRNRIGTSLMSEEERHYMWNLAFSFTIRQRVTAFKAYYAIRSYITFHGIFMAPGYDLGEGSIYKKGGDGS